MNSSETLKEFAPAFAQAQQKIEGALADKQNPHFRSKYADLGNVVDAIKPALAEHGLSFVQVCHDAEDAAKVETVILHSSGEWLSCGAVAVPVSKKDAQGYGSALTYARRYSLAAAFGVAPEDDDGNAAASAPPKPQGKAPNRPQEPSQGSSLTTGKDAEYVNRVRDALRYLFGDDKAAALAKVEELTSFVPSGKTEADRVKGIHDFTKLSGKRLEILCHNLEKLVDKKADEALPDCCDICGQPIFAEGCACPK